ncbi:Ribosome-binding protein 1 [Dissostichus eleginoides]|uniref:Ribosome-binding protein 1 n=1 Tax=Dissostichus eleginoides TaxID=100907 RepID=A0AAD9C2J4_DISEL|nr:Ribosome-binding protein 1 [Dissostichus eleginoides]
MDKMDAIERKVTWAELWKAPKPIEPSHMGHKRVTSMPTVLQERNPGAHPKLLPKGARRRTTNTNWFTNEKLRRWFNTKWLPQAKRWVNVYKTKSLKVAIYTTNGVERQNETLKHTFLEGYKNCSLSELLTVVVSDFLPKAYQKYIELNVMFSDGYRKYNTNLPQYLQNRPCANGQHILDRHFRSLDYKGAVTGREKGVFCVKSLTTSVTHLVSFGRGSISPSCTCQDWQRHLLPCTHFCVVFNTIEGCGWESLSETCRENPLFSLDIICLTKSQTDSITPSLEDALVCMEDTPNTPVCTEDTANTPVCTEDTPNTPVCMEDTPNTPVCMEETHNTPVRTEETPNTPVRTEETHSKNSGNHSKSSRDRKRQPCGTLLREITEHTYHLQDETFMCTVISRLNDLLEDVKQHTPHDSSLPPSFTPPKHKRQERTIKPQPSTSHRRHPFSGRVGHKAEVMRSKCVQSGQLEQDFKS